MTKKRRIIYAEFTRENGSVTSQVRKDPDGMWYLRKTDIFGRQIRYNPSKGILEAGRYNFSNWEEYDRFIYRVHGYDSDGNEVAIE